MCQRNAKKRRQKEVKSPNEVTAWAPGDESCVCTQFPRGLLGGTLSPCWTPRDVHVPSHGTAVTLDKLLGLSVVASR